MGQESVFVILHNVWETLDLKKLGTPNDSNHNHHFKVTFTMVSEMFVQHWRLKRPSKCGIFLTEEEAWILFGFFNRERCWEKMPRIVTSKHRHMLRQSELVRSCEKGSKNVLTELLLDGFQKVKDLRLADCESIEHLLDTNVDFVQPLSSSTHLLKIHCQDNIPFHQLQRWTSVTIIVYNMFFQCPSMEDRQTTVACSDDENN
ncbi:hypothetical protein HAX54_003473 [Datura stramonium]|uniref:Uncharacterized protein n=1 Tax=Datura stramonium TaxID=4076 RepID=A0ABS8T6L8_DATST|nr:hypothetical protein [Datura stramonium]